MSGFWIRSNPLTDTEECSECGYNILGEEWETPFCPWCGEAMILIDMDITESNLERIKRERDEITEFLSGMTKEELIEFAYKQQVIIRQLRGEE